MKSPVTKPKKIIKKVKNKKEKRAATPNERIISAFVQQRKLERYKTDIDKRIQFLKMRSCALQLIKLETQREKFNNEIISSYKGMAKKNVTNVKSSDVQKPAYTGFCTIDAILNISRVIGFEDEISKHGLCNHKLRCKKCIYRSAICKMKYGKGNRPYIEIPEIRHNMDIFLGEPSQKKSKNFGENSKLGLTPPSPPHHWIFQTFLNWHERRRFSDIFEEKKLTPIIRAISDIFEIENI